ncbi:MAG: ChaN family lipoprotein [Proteobacteria bacterium]|nr:ChaN family lipoprotein [Pseudomonadota bacterium]
MPNPARAFAAAVARTAVAVLAVVCGACAAPGASTADAALAAAVRSRPIVLLGEIHDNAGQHALRARALGALLAGGARPAILMEQFDRERQADIDRVLARPDATADDVIAAAAPARAGWEWAYYKPLIALALRYRLPLVAVNVSRDDARRAIRDGLPALGFDGEVPADIAAAQAADIEAGHCGAIDRPTAGRMVAAQEARDQFMARQLAAHASGGAVLLAGNGHVRRDVGVPRWLPTAVRERSVSIGLLEPDSDMAGAFDVAITTPAQPRPDPCEAFRAASAP